MNLNLFPVVPFADLILPTTIPASFKVTVLLSPLSWIALLVTDLLFLIEPLLVSVELTPRTIVDSDPEL